MMQMPITEQRDIKEELINILTPIFGESVKKIIVDNYDSKHPNELLDMANHLLSGYMGESNAKNMLKKVMEKSQNEKN
jgi:hypothetical protein